MSNPGIGFAGFGEAGFHIGDGLRGAGIDRMTAFDIRKDTPGLGEKIRRAEDAAVKLVRSNAELPDASDIIISTVTANQALAAAQQTAPGLRPGQLYADLNSVSPNLKQAIDRVISAPGRAICGGGRDGIEHAGSTSVPGLAAKPIIDIVLHRVPRSRLHAPVSRLVARQCK